MTGDTVAGAAYLLRGFRLLFKPGIRVYVILPLFINVLVFAGFLWLGANQAQALIDWLLPTGDAWYWALLRGVLWVVFALAALFVLYFGFTLVANLIGAPFNGLLAEKVEQHLTGRPASDGGLIKALRETVPSILSELRKFAYYLLWAIPLLVLFIVPVLNLAAPFLWTLFMAWMLSIEYGDYPMSNHGLRFKEARARLAQNRALAFGFGAMTLGATVVPLVNFLVMPAAVAGATAMWVERLRTDQ